jgi:mitotic spindle assembly checkpoint protein MAD2B
MFLDWLEGVIHTILFIREIYPPELFERTQLFNVPVQRCRAPELNEYIHDVVESLRDFIERVSALDSGYSDRGFCFRFL